MEQLHGNEGMFVCFHVTFGVQITSKDHVSMYLVLTTPNIADLTKGFTP